MIVVDHHDADVPGRKFSCDLRRSILALVRETGEMPLHRRPPASGDLPRTASGYSRKCGGRSKK
jgi:hypothetical protein